MRTSPTRTWCSGEGDRARSAEARDPRPAGPGRPELAPPPRIRRRRGEDRPAGRRRAGHGRRRGGARAARADVRAAAHEPADRELRDRGRVSEPRPIIPVLVWPGSNDDRDAQLALERLGAEAPRLWHTEESLPRETAAVVLPGGFSYGDYLRCGAIARFSPALRAVEAFAAEGGLVLGICNGFQILTEAGLLPGALRPNASLSFVCRDVPLVVERSDTPFTSRCEPGQELVVPVKHGDGCWFADGELLAELAENDQLVIRYAAGASPNASVADVAGVVNVEGNVFGLMPHPEHAVDPLLGSTDGAMILGSLVDAARLSAAVPGWAPPPQPSARASAGWAARAWRSRSRSRERSVTGPRLAP